MEVQANVPFSVDELTADWLSRGLRESGLLGDATVADINVQVLGEQVGFNGEVAIVSITYSATPEGAPDSLVLKIPTASKNRILGQTMGLYEKEIRFYRDLQSTLQIRTPQHYYSALDIADDPDIILERMEGLNRLPIFLVRLVSALATRFVSGHPRKYALLIEDLSQLRMGDQRSGCNTQEADTIVRMMAKLHGQFWDSAELKRRTWILPYSVTSRIMHMRYLKAIGRYMKEEGANLTLQQRELLLWLRENGLALIEQYGKTPATLLHGDFRLDNICFDDAANELVLFDWQTLQAGPGTSDLVYFISSTLPIETSEARINELIDLYHNGLLSEGVEVDRAELRAQYETGMVNMLHRILPTVYEDQMDIDDERGLPMLKDWLTRIYARLEHVDYQSLPVG